MTNNGSNSWGTSYSDITFLERLLNSHENLRNLSRHDDVVFEIDRIDQNDHLRVFCCRKYVMGLTDVQRAISEFGHLDIIYVGGGWNGYTPEAKEFCTENRIGLFVTNEMTGALWKNEFWSYVKRDRDGNTVEFFRN